MPQGSPFRASTILCMHLREADMYDNEGKWVGEPPVNPGPAPSHPFPNQQGYPPVAAPHRKKSRRKLVIGLVVAFAIGLALCVGGGLLLGNAADEAVKSLPAVSATEDTATDPAANEQAQDSETGNAAPVAKIGEALVVTGTATEHWTPTKVEKPVVDEWGDKAKRGAYVLVHFKVSVTEGSSFICSCALQLIDGAGKVYDPAYNSFKGREDFQSTEVGAGQNVDGWVAFDVPKTAIKGGRLQLKADTFTDTYGYWKL